MYEAHRGLYIYPTKEEIMSAKIEYSPDELEWMKTWKKTYWNKAKKMEKSQYIIKNGIKPRSLALAALIEVMASIHKRRIEVQFKPELPSACYNWAEKTIYLNNDSIISALHELSHAIHGDSELYACQWSVHLFEKFFPKAFAELRWQGHMLVK